MIDFEEFEIHEGERREFDALSRRVIGCAIEVHRTLGPGLLESTYQQCLSHELKLNKIEHICEAPLPVQYKDLNIECGYRVDILIPNSLILELKSVRQLDAVHEAQILTYLKLSGIRSGLLLNFNVPLLKDGLKRFVI